jgi:acetylglutamate kinase
MIMIRPDPSVAVRALKSAAPYIRMYKNKVFIIKAGGAVFSDEMSTRALIEQVAILHQVGIKTVLVHGGGPQLDSVQATLGIATQMVNGRRVTDQKSIDVTAMVLNGLINTRILAICRELDIEAIGLSGVDAGLIRAHKRPPVRVSEGSSETVDYGFVGNIDSVKLVLCTGAQGILERVDDPSSVVSYTDIKGLKRLRDQGALKDGMLPKAAAIENAIRGGVRRVHVISYKSADSLLAEIFTNEGTGTLVVADLTALSPAEQLSASTGA